MWMLYVNQPILDQIDHIESPNNISLFFLKNLQQQDPKDDSRRILLAQQQLELGALKEAQQTLKPLLQGHNRILRKRGHLLDLQIMEMQMLAGNSDSPDRPKLEQMISAKVRTILQDEPSREILPSLAESALLASDWELATVVYEAIAQHDSVNQASWYRKGAQLALQRGAYPKAADFFFMARVKSKGFEQKREDFLSALKALVEGNQLAEALKQAEKHLGDLDQDDVTLKFLVKLGRAAGNGAFAKKYVEKLLHVSSRHNVQTRFVSYLSSKQVPDYDRNMRLLSFQKVSQWRRIQKERKWKRLFVKTDSIETKNRLRPYDPEIYELAYTVYVENGQVEQAYAVARAAGQAVPREMRWRQRWAQTAEWTGRSAEAVAQWQVVAQQAPTPEAWAALVRLAPTLTAPAELAQAAEALTLVGAQGPEELQRVAQWALLDVRQRQVAAEGTAAQAHALQAQVVALLPMVQTVAEGEQLLTVALGQQAWGLATQVLARLGPLGTAAQQQGWLAQSARAALGQGAYQQAAAWWFVGQAQAETLGGQRQAYAAGLEALVAGQAYAAVPVAVAQQLMGELARDKAAVVSAVQALRTAGAGAEAQPYLARLWANGPPMYEAELYELAYTVYVENGQVEAAYEVARAAGQAVPEDLVWRQRWAQAAEWTGRSAEALVQWQVVAEQSSTPEAWAALVRLAPTLTAPGELTGAAEALTMVVAQGPDALQRAAQWSLLDVRQRQVAAEGTAAQAHALQAQVVALLPMVQTVAEGEQLLTVALEQQAWELATQVLARLRPLGTAVQQQGWLAQSARAALGQGAYQQASAWWFRGQGQAETLGGQRTAFEAGLEALVAGQAYAAVPEAVARHLTGELARDPAAVISAVQALRAAGAGAAAHPYLGQLWAAGPPTYAAELYELAYTVYVENGQVEAAYEVARAAGQAVPREMRWRQRWAQAAEWTGRSAEALAQWQVVAQQAPTPEAWAALVRLAPTLTAPAELAQAAEALTLVGAQGPEELQRVAQWALLEVRQRQVAAVGTAAQAHALQAQVVALLPMVQTVAEGEQLLTVALGQQAWGLATQVLARLVPWGTAAQEQGEWYAQSARAALGQGAYQQASAWWFRGQGQAETLGGQRTAFEAGLEALVAGQAYAAVPEAVALQLMGELARDKAAVVSAVQALRTAGAGAEAQPYLARLWANGPPMYEAELYELAYTVYVENGQVEAAYEVARAAGQAVPEDLVWRQRWAQAAEWTSRSAEALAQWQVVAQQASTPEAWAALVRLAPTLMAPGELTGAAEALAMVVAQGPDALQRAAQWALLDVRQRQVAAEGTAAQAHALQAQVVALLPMVQTVAEGEQLLTVALEQQAWELATQVLARLRPLGTAAQEQGEWYAQSARAALGQGAYQQAAAWWFVVQRLAATRVAQREAFEAGLEALVAGQAYAAVPEAVAQHLAGELARDPAAVLSAVQALRVAGAGVAAHPYLGQLWAAGPPTYAAELYELAYTVYVENGQVEAAYEVARAAGQAVPREMRWRQRWAQAAEWTGRSAEALAQWQVVAQQAPTPEAWAALVRLAPTLTAPAELAQAAEALTLVGAQGPEELQRVAQWALLEVRQRQVAAVGTAAQAHALQAQVVALLPMVQTVAEGEQLLTVALGQQAWGLATQVLARLVPWGTAAQEQGEWYAQSARAALGQGAYQQAAAWWFVVQRLAATRVAQREAFEAGLEALVAGQAYAAVPEAVAQQLMGELARDPAAVISAVQALRAAGAGAAAHPYLGQLWTAGPPTYAAELYELAYTVYVENGQVAQAYAVARAAGQAVPQEMRWRQRWAQAAEWTGRSAEALAQWQVVAQQASTPEAWAALVRLGRGLNDPQAWVLGLEKLDEQSGLSLEQVKDLAMAYEKVGQPDKAVTKLQEALEEAQEPQLFEYLGLLYERMGLMQDAMMVYHEIDTKFGSTLALTKKRADLFYQHGKVNEALAILLEKQDEALLEDIDYWRTVGDLAWDLQDDHAAREAYHKLYKQEDLLAHEFERYVLLVKEAQPQQAVELAKRGWSKFSTTGFFFLALDILVQEGEWEAVNQMFEELTPSQRQRLEPQQQYWLVRAETLSHLGKVDEALVGYQEALWRAPESRDIRLAMMWLLIDYKKLGRLKPLLSKWKRVAENDPRFWGGFATAYMLLEEPRKALPYFERKYRKNPEDYLWVLYYADALETSGYDERAWRLRQYAWLTLRKEAKAGKDTAWNREVILAYARLALTRETGDRVSLIFSKILQNKTDASAQELILSWYLSREKYDPARFWLWRFYGRQLSKPAFAEIALALVEDDWVAINRLLTAKDSSLDRLQKVAAAKQLNRNRLAQTLTVEGVAESSDPDLYAQALTDSMLSNVSSPLDSLHRLPLTGQLWSHTPNVMTRFLFQDRSPLVSQHLEHLWTIPLGRGIEFHPFVSRRWQQISHTDVFRRIPKADTRFGGHLRWNMGSSLGEFSLYHRKALSSLIVVRGRAQVKWGRRATTEFLAGRNLEADTSVGMLVGGTKDLLRFTHSYQVSKWDNTFLQFDYPRFYSQDRKFLGQGVAIEGAWSHHFRLAYPDFSLRVSGSLQQYSRQSQVSGKLPSLFPSSPSTIPVSHVLPEEFRQIEIGGAVGESVLFTYGQTIRPFFFGGVNVNAETGVGGNISGGVNGSLFGQDRLSVFGRYLRGGFGQNATVTEWGMHYQFWF